MVDYRQRSQSAKFETTEGGGGNQDLFSQQQTIFSTPKSSLARGIDKRARGPQGTHAITTMKSALWTTKWLTIVFPWPAQIQFSLQ